MRIVAAAAFGLAALATGPAGAQSLNDIGNMLKDRVLNQGQPNAQGQSDQERERRAYEQGRRDQARQGDGRREADQQQERYRGDQDRRERDYNAQNSHGRRRSDDESRYDGPRSRRERDPEPGRY